MPGPTAPNSHTDIAHRYPNGINTQMNHLLSRHAELLYLIPITLLIGSYYFWQRRTQQQTLIKQQAAALAGLTQPASLHPVIDPNKCLGCGACVKACPEGEILGLVQGKALLIEPANCIGHGACQQACPFDAISLVFGTAERGIDIPNVSDSFETSRNGVYIAGELGGMGLIRNAVTQGVQAVEGMVKTLRSARSRAHKSDYDLVIVGAGPAGIAAALTAMHHKLKAVVIEQDTFGGTVAHFPRNKIVMTSPVTLPLVGEVKFRETSKEALLEFWRDIIDTHQPDIRYSQQMTGLEGDAGAFTVTTTTSTYKCSALLLCLGRRGTPRTLDVPGDEQNKVIYRLDDPVQHANQHVLVVGGGDSALEAASTLAEASCASVTLSYRSGSFSRAKPKNRDRANKLAETGRLRLEMESTVDSIGTDDVTLNLKAEQVTLPNDAIIVCAGGILPTGFLKSIGITVDTKYGSL